jgi:hypothetical protein
MYLPPKDLGQMFLLDSTVEMLRRENRHASA